MCTVTWQHDASGYQLFCNRDERHTRRPALPPRIGSRDGVRFVAPIDGDFGATWIATNDFGVSLCLLNGQTKVQHRPPSTSRGLLLFELIDASSIAAVCDRLGKACLTRFAPFTLAVLEPGHPTAVVEWNGADRTIVPDGESYVPLTSSSFDPDAVREIRSQEYLCWTGSPFEFHKSHAPGPGPYSTCMHRSDAQTVSFSWIKVTGAEASFFYSPDAPCKGSTGECTSLALW
jgi:hypothetical protein